MRLAKKSDFPVGATWETVDERGRRGTIWLHKKDKHFDVWRWSVVLSDGSGSISDWCMSYKQCKEEIPIYTKFKRTA